ncbi:hypothetical protein VQL36_14560 [Chengkuizengella sp. SCS-71B]|uniref:hypothetical protein n=1 Tax=Chengkuizengella sp. SCS-71B TaxID=3115290 RepID=UPI0032C2250E
MIIKKSIVLMCIFLLVFPTLVISNEIQEEVTKKLVFGEIDEVNQLKPQKNNMTSSSLTLAQRDVRKSHISAGGNFTLGLKSDYTVAAVGSNSDGQVTVGHWRNIMHVSGGSDFTVGIKYDGTVQGTGEGENGQLQVSSWEDIVDVDAGRSHTVGLKSDGTALAVGSGGSGQKRVEDWTDIVQVSAGSEHTMGLKNDGTVVAVGSNRYGEVDGVSNWSNIIQVSAGSNFSVGLKSDGTVLAVGNNIYGAIDVEDWTDIVQVSAGLVHTVGLKSDGTVVAVGSNSFGQVSGVSNWTDIVEVSANGTNQTIGLKSDGTVVAVGMDNYGQVSEASSWTDLKIPPPFQPTNLITASTDSQVQISWDKIIGADLYNIKRSTSLEGPYTVVGSGIIETQYIDLEVIHGTTYYYVVSAENNSGESRNSNEVSAVTLPTVPTGLSTTPEGGDGVQLNWIESIGAESYTIMRSEVSGGPYTTIESGISTTSYVDTNISKGITYYYVIKAINNAGESETSNEVMAITIPSPPSDLSITSGDRKVQVQWDDSIGAESYTVMRSEASGGPYVTIKSEIPTTSYIDTSVTNENTYYYVVSAVNGGGESDNSEEVSVVPFPTEIPLTPSGITTVVGDGAVRISWNVSTGASASSYTVKRSLISGGPYTIVESGLQTMNYIDYDVSNGTTYFYVVSAINRNGESDDSVEVIAIPEFNGTFFGSFTHIYDEEDRLTSVILPNGQTMVYEYDHNGNLNKSYILE